MKLIDRYLLARYFYVFLVFFTAAMGLFVIADGFTNLDDFQRRAGDGGSGALLSAMGQHYLYQSSRIFSLAGPTLAVMSAMCVLALTLRHGEIHPLLAAGVPLYRVSLPLVAGVLAINVLLTLNEELIIPRIASHLQMKHGDSGSDAQEFDPTYDASRVHIFGKELVPATGTIREARFMVPKPLLADPTLIIAAEASYQPEIEGLPAGWLLKDVRPAPSQLRLMPQGEAVIYPARNGKDLLVRSTLTFDQLYNRSTGFRYLSTRDLVWRIRNPGSGEVTRRAQVLHFHERLTRPLLTLVGVFLVIPLVARREKLSLVSNVAWCMAAVGGVYIGAQAMLVIGQVGWIAPAACAWAPLIGGGTLGAWISSLART